MPRAAIRLRVAGPADVGVLIEHRLAMWRAIRKFSEPVLAAHARAYERWIRRAWKRDDFVAYLLEAPDGSVAASGAVWFPVDHPRPGHSAASGYLLSIFTDPAYRRRGLASRIVRAGLRECRRRAVTRVTLHASPYGRSVYRRLGFERSWEMRMNLSPPRPRPPRATARR